MSNDQLFNQLPSGEEQEMEQRIWQFLDGTAGQEERSIVEQLVQEDAAWKTKYQELLGLNELLKGAELDQPPMRFTKNVMEEIARLHVTPAAKKYINNRIIWGIGIFFITMLIGTLVYGFSQMLSSPGEATEISKNIERFDISRFFNSNLMYALMMVNVVIGLFFLDNYFNSQRKKYRKEAE